MFWSLFRSSCSPSARHPGGRQRRVRRILQLEALEVWKAKPQLETLEDRTLLSTLQAVSLANSSLYATGAGGGLSQTGRTISDDSRYVVYEGNRNTLPGATNYAQQIFVRDLQTGSATLVSVNTGGTDGNDYSGPANITPNGRYVVFASQASDLVSGDNNGLQDIFVRDLVAGTTTLVSINSSGTGSASGLSQNAVVTPDGRYVAFESYARDLVSGDTSFGRQIYRRDLVAGTTTLVSTGQGSGTYIAENPLFSDDGRYVCFESQQSYSFATHNIYVRDVVAGTTTLVSVNTSGNGGGNYDSTSAVMTPSGRYVAWVSLSSNLVAGDTNGATDVFVRDLSLSQTVCVSVNSSGVPANGSSGLDGAGNPENPAISADGLYVAFTSGARDLTGGGPLGIFRRDLTAHTTTEVSVSTTGGQPNNFSQYTWISADGRYVLFDSAASNLVNVADGNPDSQSLFVRDVSAATTALVNINHDGTASSNHSVYSPTLTTDGSKVAFGSDATDLVAQDGDGLGDVFVRDLTAQTTTLVSFRDANTPSLTGNGQSSIEPVSWHPSAVASSDGRYVAFTSLANNLAAGDNNNQADVFVTDRVAATVTLVSENQAGTGSGNAASRDPVISADGRYVAFDSAASNLVATDNNASSDVFVRDLQTGTTSLISVNSAGTDSGAGTSDLPILSPNGRFVAFQSNAPDLTNTSDTNGTYDVFLRDRQTGTTTLVSVNTSGVAGNGYSTSPSISPDGRYVVFESYATDLVSGLTVSGENVYVRDLQSGTTSLVSINSAGSGSGNGNSLGATITPDGRYVVFQSDASNLVANDTNGATDVFVRDLVTGTTTLVSTNQAGTGSGNGASQDPAISANGRYVAFDSLAGNLVGNDSNGASDVFVRDLVAGTTTLVSVNATGTASGNHDSTYPVLSSDGQSVLFMSHATDLVANDNNAGESLFLRNLSSGVTTLIDPHGSRYGYVMDQEYALTADAQHVVFDAQGDDLTSGDYNGQPDTYVWSQNNSASTLGISGFPSPTTAGVSGSFTVSALDSGGHVVTSYTGTVHFTSSDPQAVLPADYTFTAADAGQHTFSATLSTAGTQSLTATDTVTSSITGTQSGILVEPANFLVNSFPPTTTAGAAHSFSVTARNADGSTASGYTGTVHFSSSDPQASLPADYTFTGTDAGVHTFTATLKTAGSQSLTAVDTTVTSVTGTQSGITVNAAAVSQLGVAGYPSPTVAGVAHTFTITAQDPYGNTVAGYRGTVHFTSSDRSAVLPSNYTFVAADNGVHSFSATLKTAGTQSLTATDTATSSITGTLSITVNAAAATHFRVTGFPSPSTAGVTGSFSVTALDPYGNVATTYGGTVHFASSDRNAVLPANYTFVGSDQGSHSFSATLKTAGTQSLTARDTVTSSITGTESGIVVTPAATAKLAVAAPRSATAGTAFSVTVTAQDAYGNTTPGYTGTIHFTSSDSRATLPANYTFTTSDRGVHVFSNGVTLITAGGRTVTATDTLTSGITGTSATITVSAAALDHFKVAAPTSATAGTAFTITVTAQDAYNNTVTTYTGTVHFTSSDAHAVLPADYTFVTTNHGVHSFSVTLKTAGSQSVTVTDLATSRSGNATVTVHAAAASTLRVSAPASVTTGTAFSFTITAQDAYGNIATGYTGTIHFTSSDTRAALPANYTFTAADAGVHTFTATMNTSGTQSLTATDTAHAGITGTDSAIQVAAALLESVPAEKVLDSEEGIELPDVLVDGQESSQFASRSLSAATLADLTGSGWEGWRASVSQLFDELDFARDPGQPAPGVVLSVAALLWLSVERRKAGGRRR